MSVGASREKEAAQKQLKENQRGLCQGKRSKGCERRRKRIRPSPYRGNEANIRVKKASKNMRLDEQINN